MHYICGLQAQVVGVRNSCLVADCRMHYCVFFTCIAAFCLPGREWSDWSSELRIPGDELKWKFISDGSVNGWGWRFTVYPIMPVAGNFHCLCFCTSTI